MVDCIGGREYIGVVTIFTDVSRLYVCRTLADGLNAIVAAGTIIDDTEVVEVRWPPGDC